MAEYFRRGAYSDGLRELTIAVVQKVAAEYNVQLDQVPQARLAPARASEATQVSPILLAIVIIIVILIIVYINSQRGTVHRAAVDGMAEVCPAAAGPGAAGRAVEVIGAAAAVHSAAEEGPGAAAPSQVGDVIE